MFNPLIDTCLLSNINILNKIPLPIFKFIIDQTFASLFNLCQGIQFNMINKILQNQQVSAQNWQNGVRSLQYVLKFSYKNQMPSKFIRTFLNQNTILNEDMIIYFLQNYEKYQQQKQQTPKVSEFKKINWGAFNLYKGKNKKIMNTMYMKVNLQTIENGQLKQKSFLTQLPQFKLLIQQFNKINNMITH